MRTDATVGPWTRRRVGEVFALLLAVAMAVTMAGAPPASAQPEPEVTRIDGGPDFPADVRAIAVQTCRALLPDAGTADRVLIARDDAFADSLTAAPLAGDTGCILYTGAAPAALDPLVRAEVDRVLAAEGQVEVLGGINAVSQGVEDELVAAGHTVRRLEGPTRYETAATIAEIVRADAPATAFTEVVLAYGEDWPDAVTAGAYAAAQGVPIVLTQTASLHPAAAAFIAGGSTPDRTTVVGGDLVISDAAAAQAPNPERFAGTNRMGTAAAITTSLWPTAGATGIDFVAVNLELPSAWTAALAAAPLSAQRGAPQLGVRTDELPIETAAVLDAVAEGEYDRAPQLTLMGDLSSISAQVSQQLSQRVSGTTPPPARCDPADSTEDAEIPAEATRVEQIMADIDGNGVDDQLTTFFIDSQGGEFFAFHVLTSNGYATIALLDADEVADVRPLGTATIGEGSPVAFVIEQAAASRFTVSLFALHDFDDDGCDLGRVTIPDHTVAPQFPVGNGEGLQCRTEQGVPALAFRSARGEGPAATEFEWTESVYTWPGFGALQFVSTDGGTFTSPQDDAQIQAFSQLDCPGVTNP